MNIEISSTSVLLFSLAILGVFFSLFAAFWLAWRYSFRKTCLSPYSGMPLRRGSDLSYYNVERVLRYLYGLQDYSNRLIDTRYAAVCRETGRIFPNSITWFDTISVDWDFLQKRRPGNYVSWGSLSLDQQEYIKKLHGDLKGFQTEESSPTALPRAVEPQYAFTKPGPLYVDIDTYVLIGWKVVPDTELEVLIVKHPSPKKPIYFTPLPEELD
jgi:hypothetical protein